VILATSMGDCAMIDLARHAGHAVRVTPVTLRRSLGVGAHGGKTQRPLASDTSHEA